ncbi:anti-sigma factor family protein [Lyngbya confervoides]|uniref:Zf-HC2 domain-containing protein n=1 Tax=Lyngbya confervoides BDU141951 TaxID=1574623 RepID=A0ABD4T308_9CYAN|nr:zf-HC2 domain-containing protein [Lyngbya confervoides]MCM1982979.1 zf-HC2 domain-containing protein [Lyngbya confervoides BDU141951]
MTGLNNLNPDDRFELLSAYLDNEVSASERKHVEALMAADPDFERQYRTLAQIGRSLQAMPVSASNPEETLHAVLKRVEHRSHRLKLLGVGAAVVAVVGTLGTLFSGSHLSPQMADNEPDGDSPTLSQSSPPIQLPPGPIAQPPNVDVDSLLLALEEPPIDIPAPGEE